MIEPFEESYFNWLCAKVNHVEVPTPSLTYYRLFRVLHNTEFIWLIPGDDNRADDGRDLRARFIVESGMTPDNDVYMLGCSVLEMLIAFAIRVEFQTDTSAHDWFRIFIDNLNLSRYTDASRISESRIQDIIQTFVWRRYEYNGTGGLFPLRRAEHDQRSLEIWYQFCDYLVDIEY